MAVPHMVQKQPQICHGASRSPFSQITLLLLLLPGFAAHFGVLTQFENRWQNAEDKLCCLNGKKQESQITGPSEPFSLNCGVSLAHITANGA